MLGLTSLLKPVSLPESITCNYGSIIKALIFLATKSVEIRTKERKKEEMAEVEDDLQGGIYEEEDDFGIDLDSNDEDDEEWDQDEEDEQNICLYDSPLD